MSSDLEPPVYYVNPRPGVLKTLGICNIVFAVLSMICIGWSTLTYFAITSAAPKAKAEVQVADPTTPAKKAGVPMVVAFNPFMGMDDPAFMRFSLAENGWSFLVNGIMFATGIGLINRKLWGARGWGILAWVRIISVVIIWGYYIVAVAPSFSETMAKAVVAQFASQGLPQARVPSVADLTRVYSIMNLIIAVGVMLISSIYPAISLWLLSRPGVKAAIVDKPALEPELP